MAIEHEISGNVLITKVPAPTAEDPRTLSRAVESALSQILKRTAGKSTLIEGNQAYYGVSGTGNRFCLLGKVSFESAGTELTDWTRRLDVGTFRFELSPGSTHNLDTRDPDPFKAFELGKGFSCKGTGVYQGASFGSAKLKKTTVDGVDVWQLSNVKRPLDGILDSAPEGFNATLTAPWEDGSTTVTFSTDYGSVIVNVGGSPLPGAPLGYRRFLYVPSAGHSVSMYPSGLCYSDVDLVTLQTYRNDPDNRHNFTLPDKDLNEGWYDVTDTEMFNWDVPHGTDDITAKEGKTVTGIYNGVTFEYAYVMPKLAWTKEEADSHRMYSGDMESALGVTFDELNDVFGDDLNYRMCWCFLHVYGYGGDTTKRYVLEVRGNGSVVNFGGYAAGERRRFFDIAGGEGGYVSRMSADSLSVIAPAPRYSVPAVGWTYHQSDSSWGAYDATVVLDPVIGSRLDLSRCVFTSIGSGAFSGARLDPVRGHLEESTATGCLFSGFPDLVPYTLPKSVLGVDIIPENVLENTTQSSAVRNRWYHGVFPHCSFRNCTFLASFYIFGPVPGAVTLFGKAVGGDSVDNVSGAAKLDSCFVRCDRDMPLVYQGAVPPPGWTPTQHVSDVSRCLTSPVPALPGSVSGLLGELDYVLRTWPVSHNALDIDASGRPLTGRSPAGFGGNEPVEDALDPDGKPLAKMTPDAVPLYPRGCWSATAASGETVLPMRMCILGTLSRSSWPKALSGSVQDTYIAPAIGRITVTFEGVLAYAVLGKLWTEVSATVGGFAPDYCTYCEGTIPAVSITVVSLPDGVVPFQALPVVVRFKGAPGLPDLTVTAGTVYALGDIDGLTVEYLSPGEDGSTESASIYELMYTPQNFVDRGVLLPVRFSAAGVSDDVLMAFARYNGVHLDPVYATALIHDGGCNCENPPSGCTPSFDEHEQVTPPAFHITLEEVSVRASLNGGIVFDMKIPAEQTMFPGGAADYEEFIDVTCGDGTNYRARNTYTGFQGLRLYSGGCSRMYDRL